MCFLKVVNLNGCLKFEKLSYVIMNSGEEMELLLVLKMGCAQKVIYFFR